MRTHNKETIDHQLHCPIRRPSRDMATKRFLYITQVVVRTSSVTAMPCSTLICEVRSQKKKISHLNRISKQKETLPFLGLSFFQACYGRFCIFLDRCIGHISRTKQKKKKKASLPFVAWYMINTLSKNHIPICNVDLIERGMAKLPLRQHLGWPSS